MYYKFSPIIIVLLVIVVIGIGIFGVKMLFNKNNSNANANEIVEVSEIVPTLDLSLSSDEENQEEVTINATASTEDADGIYSITLPDGSVNRSDVASYKATKNGTYTFKVKGNNGQTSTLTINVENIREASANSPYIPTGFSHVGGEPDSGYVIEDSYGNQYVWVPVESGKLDRNTLLDTNYEESNNTASALVNSVAQNYGFYIARFEACQCDANGEKIAGTIGDKVPWTNVTYLDAATAAARSGELFGYEGYQTAIINSYAWDTAISWISNSAENYSSSTNYGNYSGSIRNTGQTETDIRNNICDMAGNVREWTTEIYKVSSTPTNNTSSSKKNKNKNTVNEEEIVSETVSYRVIRGGSANLSRTANSHTGYKENTSDSYWGFRMVLYK